MKRATCLCALLLLCGWLQARAGLHGAAFAFKQADGRMWLQPMISPGIAVRQEKGPREINRGEVLVCRGANRKQKALVDGKEAVVIENVLTCGDRVFVIEGIRFEE